METVDRIFELPGQKEARIKNRLAAIKVEIAQHRHAITDLGIEKAELEKERVAL